MWNDVVYFIRQFLYDIVYDRMRFDPFVNCIHVILVNVIDLIFRKNLSFPLPFFPLFFLSFFSFTPFFFFPSSFFSPSSGLLLLSFLSLLPFFPSPLLFLFFTTLCFSRSVGWFSRWAASGGALCPCPPGCYTTGTNQHLGEISQVYRVSEGGMTLHISFHIWQLLICCYILRRKSCPFSLLRKIDWRKI